MTSKHILDSSAVFPTQFSNIYIYIYTLVRAENAQTIFSIFHFSIVFPFLRWKTLRAFLTENGKKTEWKTEKKRFRRALAVEKSPGRGGPHLSGDVQSSNVSKSIGLGRVFMRENRT